MNQKYQEKLRVRLNRIYRSYRSESTMRDHFDVAELNRQILELQIADLSDQSAELRSVSTSLHGLDKA